MRYHNYYEFICATTLLCPGNSASLSLYSAAMEQVKEQLSLPLVLTISLLSLQL